MQGNGIFGRGTNSSARPVCRAASRMGWSLLLHRTCYLRMFHVLKTFYSLWYCCVATFLALVCPGAIAAATTVHAGPDIRVMVQRGAQTLPLDLVDHLRRGDQLRVSVARETLTTGAFKGPWLLVVALVSPGDKQVSAQRFDLSAKNLTGTIEVADDAQVPVLVVAPQIKTFFGLGTSFQQSADLIVDALNADPQRFIDLQKIDQVDKAISSLQSGLDALVQTLKPEDVVDATKAVAAKFGAKTIDPDCLKSGVVDTRCVATSIVSSQDLKIPSASDLGAMAQPLLLNALSADLLLNVRLVAATSSFLAAKFHDQYEMAPSAAHRDVANGVLHLYSSIAFKNGDIKTAYVFVPSGYGGTAPLLARAAGRMECLASGRIPLNLTDPIPPQNYWHDWHLKVAGSAADWTWDGLQFNPETGDLRWEPAGQMAVMRQQGFQVHVRLDAQYAFDAITPLEWDAAVPSAAPLQAQLGGLETLISGSRACFLSLAPRLQPVSKASLWKPMATPWPASPPSFRRGRGGNGHLPSRRCRRGRLHWSCANREERSRPWPSRYCSPGPGCAK